VSGIVFWGTRMLTELKRFYLNQVGCQVWLEQADCVIFRNGNLLFGFCERNEVDMQGLITFFYDTKQEVDRIYETFKTIDVSPPATNDKYHIYYFFAHDPEGRKLEFQYFNHSIDKYLSGDELLLSRRSIRDFKQTDISESILNQVLDNSRFAPTARNSQSYYFKIIRNRELLNRLSGLRGKSSSPIGRAPLAVAICSDPELSTRHIQDGCIAAYHFMLAAYFFGLGTCWIAAMDREDVKSMLGVPEHHYVTTITPLGYPMHLPVSAPSRKELGWFVKE